MPQSAGRKDPDELVYNAPDLKVNNEVKTLSNAVQTLSDNMKEYISTLIYNVKTLIYMQKLLICNNILHLGHNNRMDFVLVHNNSNISH